MKLLVDLGNTRLKWATLVRQRLQVGGVFAHVGASFVSELRREWSELARVEEVLVASVIAKAREDELADFVRERFDVRVQFLRSSAAALGVRNAYADPARLGIDRFLALAAAHAHHPRAQVLVSVGTALTIDALGADGTHRGGLIVASPGLMRKALLAGTARVGVADGHYENMPRTTADAVVSGSLYAAVGAIDRFRISAAHQLGTPPALLLTGGGADELASFVDATERVHDLVLSGLALWAADADARAG